MTVANCHDTGHAVARRLLTVETMTEFSPVMGGPLYRLMLRGHLVRPAFDWTRRRVIACIAVTWLPLAVLTALAGTFAGGARLPFLFDIEANAKLLFALPFAVGAEGIVHKRILEVMNEISRRGLVTAKDEPRFEAAVTKAMRLRNSAVVEAALAIFAFTGGYFIWRVHATLPVSTWYSAERGGTTQLTTAGMWYAFVALPLGRFILLRWYFRIVVWYVLLWRISRLELVLDPLHPDRAGGLAFFEHALVAFVPISIAQSAFVSAVFGNHIVNGGATLTEYKVPIAGLVVFLVLQVVTPLLFFVPALLRAKIRAQYAFGRFATRYASEFSDKWLASKTEEPLLGTPDLQSLADLANSYEVVRTMRVVPFEPRLLLVLAGLIAAPFVPLALTMMPLEELVRGIMKLLL